MSSHCSGLPGELIMTASSRPHLAQLEPESIFFVREIAVQSERTASMLDHIIAEIAATNIGWQRYDSEEADVVDGGHLTPPPHLGGYLGRMRYTALWAETA